MSEHTPITGELREAVEWEPTFCGPDKAMVPQPEFDRICDAIDAVHAGLERENAELRERVAVLDNRSESMHDGGRITDELRKWAEGSTLSSWTAEHLTAIADRIDAEHEAQLNDAFETRNSDENLESDGWIRLPKDADGVLIHIGDVLDGYGKTIEVVELRIGRSGWVIISRDGNGYADTFAFTHHHVPTVEDVLREFAYGLGVPVADSYIAATAVKLRLAGSDAK